MGVMTKLEKLTHPSMYFLFYKTINCAKNTVQTNL